jgi:hypothetical protein
MTDREKNGRWTPGGQSPNPKGKPVGAVSPSTKLRKMIEEYMPGVIATLIVSARKGDTTAAGILLSRSLPPLRPSRDNVVVDGVTSKSTPAEIAIAVTRAACAGTLPADVAADLAAALASVAKVREVDELVRRLDALEAAGKPDA